MIQYEFESVSEEKIVKKLIEYVMINEDIPLYNLSLLDIDVEGASDLSVSNNKDLPKIMATVYQTLRDFFVVNPQAKVFFQGSTTSRNRLYRAAVGKLIALKEPGFLIFDFKDGKFREFESNTEYEAFLVQL